MYVVAKPVFFLQNEHLVFFPEASWGGGGGLLRITGASVLEKTKETGTVKNVIKMPMKRTFLVDIFLVAVANSNAFSYFDHRT